MPHYRPGDRVRLHGLLAAPALNGRLGTVQLFDNAKGRYGVRLSDAATGSAPLLVRPSNMEAVFDAAYNAAAAVELAAKGGEAGRKERLSELVRQSATQHALKEEGSSHAAAVAAASSRAELDEDVWDRVVEIQRLVQSTCNACDAGFPALQLESIEADDALTWSRASVEYAHYLLGQAPKDEGTSGVDEAKRVAKRVLQIHACTGRAACRDAMLATAVCRSEGPFARADAELLLATAPNICPLIDGEAWATTRERDAMQRTLQAAWDVDTHERLRAKAAKIVAELPTEEQQAEGSKDGH